MAKPPSIQTLNFRRGQEIYISGPRPSHIYVVQSGLVSVCILKDDCTQLHLVGPMQTLREEVLLNGPSTGTSAIALRETQILEIPIENMRSMMESAPAPLGVLIKGLLERIKVGSNEIRSLKLSRDAHPCPGDFTAKVFGVIFYTARYLGVKEGDGLIAEWSALKTYAIEIFHEEPVRLEEAIMILAKLGYAEPLTSAPGDEKSSQPIPAPEKWARICFRNMAQIEAFFDFYQNYHFKGGYAAFLKTNEKSTELTQALVRLAENYKSDRSGMVTMPYKATVDSLKETLGKGFEADQIFRLEQKGLMVKRVSTQEGGLLSFFKPEFEQMLLNWKVLREVEIWNEKGYVVLPEKAPDASATGSAPIDAKQSAQLESASAALENWKPLVLAGGKPVIRTEPPRPNESLCPCCLSPVLDSQTYCSVCDSQIPKKAA